VDACPSGYTSISDSDMCSTAAASLGLSYDSSQNDGHANAVCNYCGGCSQPIVRLRASHGANADWICVSTTTAPTTTTTTTSASSDLYTRGVTGVDACPSGYTSISDSDMCSTGAASLGLSYDSSQNDVHANAVCNYCGGCSPPIVRLKASHGANADWICVSTTTATTSDCNQTNTCT